MLFENPRQVLSEYRDFVLVLLLAIGAAGLLATFAAVERESGRAIIIWLATVEVALIGTALLSTRHSRRRNWLVISTLSGIMLAVGALLVYLA